MKLTVTKAALVRGLQLVVPVVSTKNTLPVLNNILVDATDSENKGLIKLSANDLEMGIECYVAATITQKGAVTIPAKRFNDIVKELSDGNIDITEDNLQIQVKAGKSKFNIVGLSATEFPTMVKQDETVLKTFTVAADMFADMLTKVSFSASKDAQKFVLTGVCFDFQGNSLNLVTTDGRRMSYVKYEDVKIDEGFTAVQALVPFKAVSDIVRLISATPIIKDTVKEATLKIGDNVLTLTVGDITFQTRLIEGIYPKYEQVIPKKQTATKDIVLPVSQLLQAVKQVSLLARETSPSVVFSFDKNMVEIFAKSDKGEAKTEIELANAVGSAFEVAFNPIFVREVLQTIDGGNVTISYTSPQAPVKFTIEGQTYIYIVMPMKR